MALTVTAKNWAGPIESGWVLFGPPGDITAPTAPVIELVEAESTAATVRVASPALDAQTGVQDYIFTANGVDSTPVAAATAQAGYRITGLTPSTSVSVTAVARDGSRLGPNVSSASNTLTFTTDAATTETVFRNWPIMNVSCQQGDIFQGVINSTHRQATGEKDVIIFQWFYPNNSRLSLRTTGLQWLKTNYPYQKRLMYVIPNETVFNYPSTPGSGANELCKDLADDAIEGNSNWYVRRLNGDKVGANFSPLTLAQMNMATNDAGLNSLGERYDEAFFRTVDERFNSGTPANFHDTFVDGYFIDNCNIRPPQFYLLGSSSTTVTDCDFDDDGVAEVANLYTSASNAGGRMFEEGVENMQDTVKTRNPNHGLACNSSRWIYNYFDGLGTPPAPTTRIMYGAWKDFLLYESVSNNIGIWKSGSAYSFSGGSMSLHFRRATAMERFLAPDSQSAFGKGAVLYHAVSIDRTPVANDYQYARTILCMALLMPRAAPCVSIATTKPMALDELFVYLGNPLTSRSMGTLNDSTSALAWVMREPDYEDVGAAAEFHWAEFEQGIVVLRTDSPTVGVWPSADAAVACVLPSAGAGKKWQRIDCTTYTNPITGFAMRGQDTTLNSGADVTTSVSLKPYHGIILRRVNA